MKKTTSLLTIILLIFTINLMAQDENTFVKEGQKAPDFTITMENGLNKSLSDLEGKVVWINFFATWCPPCRKELPHLQEAVYEEFKNRDDFEVLVIGREHTWEEVNKFKKDNNYTLPFYPDPERKIFSKYAKQTIPRNFVIDKDGNIAVASTGYNKEDFEKIISKVEDLLKN
ncbi:MAG TPA: TlpA disulfide reductase family protein [Tangfeifania sp.]|nr:TlpA disulfide reductase family protein [Tangfeifania sp.]